MREYCFKVCFGNGRYAGGTYDVVAEDEDMAIEMALSEICQKLYKALPDLDIEVSVELDEEDCDGEDDNDFLQDLMDEDETESFIECWLDQLLEATGKPNIDELTAEEIRAEIDDIKGTIDNESIVIGISEFAEKNIEHYEAYLERLEEMLKNKEN